MKLLRLLLAAITLSLLLQPITSAQGTAHHGRAGRALKQGAGVGAGCDSIFTEADNGSGYTVEDLEDTLGGDLGGGTGAGGQPGGVSGGGPGGRKLSQLNKVVDGANVLLTALHDPQLGNAIDVVGNDYDNQGTNDAAALGMEIGQAEASLPEVTQAIPGRKMLAAKKHGRALKQGAGVGAGCNSIFTEADNGSGYIIKNIETTLGGDFAGAGKKLLSTLGFSSHKRALKQGAGVGAGCDSIFTEADNGSGYTVEDLEDTLGEDLGGSAGAGKGGGSGMPQGGPGGRKLSQLNKVVDGANVLLTALHDPQLGNAIDVVGNDYDNQGTNDAAALGMEIGQAEASLPEVTQAIPGRRMLEA